MKTVFEKTIRDKLAERIQTINNNSTPLWGKMNVYQMTRHNTYWNEWILGKGDFEYKQEFIGKIFGKIALKRMLKDGKPFDKNISTSNQFKVEEINGNLDTEKSKWITLLNEYENYTNDIFIHDFFGVLTKEQIGILVYKHSDHHLRQFGA